MEKTPYFAIDRQKIRKHWGKTSSETEEYIESLKEWIKTKNFPEMPTDHIIEFFLTNCKYNVEKTKTNIETYYTFRKFIPEIYEESNPKLPEMQETWNMGCYCPLPKLANDLYRIAIVRVNPDLAKFNAARYFANFMNIYEVRICEDLVLSEIIIVDYRYLRWNHVFQFSPFLLKKMIYIMENVAKSRIKQIHIVEAPTYMNILIAIGKKLMKKKMSERIQVHKNFESLYEFVPQEHLPSDYGGTEKSLEELNAIWRKKVEEYQDRFDMWDKIAEDY